MPSSRGPLLAGFWFGLELSGALLVNFVPGHTRTHEKAWEASAGMFDSDVIAVLLLVLLLLLLSRLLHSMEKNGCPEKGRFVQRVCINGSSEEH